MSLFCRQPIAAGQCQGFKMLAGQGSLRQLSSTLDRFSIRWCYRFTITLFIAILIGRSAGAVTVDDEKLQIRSSADPTIVSPGTAMNVSVSVRALRDHASAEMSLRYTLLNVANGQTALSGRKPVSVNGDGDSDAILINDVSPAEEGVYELRCALEYDSQPVWSRFRRRDEPIAERRHPIVVLGSDSGAAKLVAEIWNTIATLRPSESSWSVEQWLPKRATRLIPGGIGSSGELTNGTYAEESISVIDPQNVFQAALPVAAHHLPHKITIRFPALLAASLQVDVASGSDRSGLPVSFVLSGDAYRWTDISAINSAKKQSGGGKGEPTRWATHTFVYYPSGNDQISLTNLSDKKKVSFESIRVEAGPKHLLPSSMPLAMNRGVALRIQDSAWSDSATSDLARRDILKTCDDATVTLYRTWVAVERLSDYVCFHGMNGVVIACPDENRLAILRRLFGRHSVAMWIEFTGEIGDPKFPERIKAAIQKDQAEGPLVGVVIRVKPTGIDIAPSADRTNEFFSSIKQAIPSGTKVFIQTDDAQLVPEDVATLRQFVHQPHERLQMKTEFQHHLMSASRTLDAAPTAAIVGQSAKQDQTVVLSNQLARDTCRIIDQLNPSALFVELPLSASPLNLLLADVLQGFASAPNHQVRSVDTSDTAVQTIRMHVSSGDGQTYVSFFSLAPWSSDVEFTAPKQSQWEVVSGVGSVEPIADGTQKYRVVVPAGSAVVIRSSVPAEAIDAWTASVSGGPAATESLKRQITSIVERIGVLATPVAYDGLINGGFEQSGGMGLVGWMHAQHPRDCVLIDKEECFEGKQAVMLTTDAAVSARTWLVSETILPPQTGRLAVSMACRGAIKSDDSVHRLRISIEGTQDGSPVRQSAEFAVPCNGVWADQGIVLEADMIDPIKTESLRVTIDSLSPGRVWIDDVRLHDYFPTARERTELQSQAFLAVQGLQRGNLTASARLLQNHWARYLLSTPVAVEVSATAPEPVIESSPGVADRMKSWLPRPLRF